MADDEWEDTLVTSWIYPGKRTEFYVCRSSRILVNPEAGTCSRFLAGVLPPTRPTGLLALLYGDREYQETHQVHKVQLLDHQTNSYIGRFRDLTDAPYRVISLHSRFVMGYLSSDGTRDLLVDADGELTFGVHKVRVKMQRFQGLNCEVFVPEWVEYFKWDKLGVIFIDQASNQVRELRANYLLKYPNLSGVRSFAADESQIFVMRAPDSGCKLTKLNRNKIEYSRTIELSSLEACQDFREYQFECLQAYAQYLLICFRSRRGQARILPDYLDHHLLMFKTSDLSLIQVLRFSSCGFLPRKLHTKNTWNFLGKHNQSQKIQHVPFREKKIPYPETLSDADIQKLSGRNIYVSKGHAGHAWLREMTIFPYDANERLLVVAIRTTRRDLYLFGINKGRLSQCEGLRLFDCESFSWGQQFKIIPTPDLKGIIAVSNHCIVENIRLERFSVNI